jgi:hypothetical protein
MNASVELCGSMTPAEYLAQRVEQYITWYDAKAVTTKSKYLQNRAASVVGGALVPVLVNISLPYLSYLTTALSLTVVVLVSLESVYHYREQWKNYRSTEQYLSREKFLYLAGEGPYKKMEQRDAFILFVERVEAAIESENASTLNAMTLASQSSLKPSDAEKSNDGA